MFILTIHCLLSFFLSFYLTFTLSIYSIYSIVWACGTAKWGELSTTSHSLLFCLAVNHCFPTTQSSVYACLFLFFKFFFPCLFFSYSLFHFLLFLSINFCSLPSCYHYPLLFDRYPSQHPFLPLWSLHLRAHRFHIIPGPTTNHYGYWPIGLLCLYLLWKALWISFQTISLGFAMTEVSNTRLYLGNLPRNGMLPPLLPPPLWKRPVPFRIEDCVLSMVWRLGEITRWMWRAIDK